MQNHTLQNDENNRGQENKKAPEDALRPLWLAIGDDLRTLLQ